MKMKHEAYIELNEDLIREYYSKDDYKKYKGYRLIAIDGSRIALPNKKEIIEEYGLAINNTGRTIPMATNSTAYDVQNNLVINTFLDRYGASEVQLAEDQLERIKDLKTSAIKDILIMDRGYNSLHFIMKMHLLSYDFVFRSSLNGFLKETNQAAKSSNIDTIVEIDLRTKKTNKQLQDLVVLSGIKKIKLRVVHVPLKACPLSL